MAHSSSMKHFGHIFAYGLSQVYPHFDIKHFFQKIGKTQEMCWETNLSYI